jgi:hypothetical protein
VVVGGVLGLAGAVMSNGNNILAGSGILVLIAIIIFPVGFQSDLTSLNAPFGIFSSGTYSTYLSYGFWLALVAAIIMLIATRYPKPIPHAPPPAPQITGTEESADPADPPQSTNPTFFQALESAQLKLTSQSRF